MLEMENMEVDQNDFPVYPPKIYKTEVYEIQSRSTDVYVKYHDKS